MDASTRPRFHLAMPVDDLDAARAFYGGMLGCAQGRSAETWIDWDFRGHQIVTHLAASAADRIHNPVDGHDVPVPHFGLILTVADFHELAERLRAAGTTFVIEPYVRFAGEKARLKLRLAMDGQRNFVGTLRAVNDGKLELEVDGKLLALDLGNIEKARLVPNI